MSIDLIPRHAQELMRDWIIDHNRCNVWASPGVGKTGSTYLALDLLKLLGSKFFPALVLAPKKVALDVWPREQRKWNQFRDLRITTLAGRDPHGRIEQLRRCNKGKVDIASINYEQIQWLVDYYQTRDEPWPFRTIVADESTRLKGFRLRNGGKRAMALARMQKYVGRWINLTGTPSPNGYIDLWGQCWFLDRGERLGRTFTAYKNEFFDEDIYTGNLTLKLGAEEEISRRLSDITISLRAEDYFDLPPLTHNRIYVNLSPKAQELYDRMERDMFVEFGANMAEALNAGTATMKCLQMASGAVYVREGGIAGDATGEYEEFDSAKLDALESLVNEMSGEPLLTAYHWRFDKTRIAERLLNKFGFEPREIKTSDDIDAWNAKRIPVGLIYPGSGGHGIDLAIGGHHLCFYSHWWDLEAYMQVIERLGPTRQAQHGLNRPVFLHHIISAGTLDEAVIERREGKKSMQDILIERMRK